MPNAKFLVFYILFLVIFNYFAGELYLSRAATEFSLQNEIPLSEFRADISRGISIINANQDPGFFEKLFDGTITFLSYIGLFMVTILSYLGFIIKIIGTGIGSLPAVINVLMLVPLGVIIAIDYILPFLRG